MDEIRFTEEQIAKAKECKSADELLAYMQSEGVELTDEDLDTVSGGAWFGSKDDNGTVKCPKCKSGRVTGYSENLKAPMAWKCWDCGHTWEE